MLKELIEEVLDLGLGTIALTKEKAESVIESLTKEGQVSKDEGQKLLKELIKKGAESRKELDKLIKQGFEESIAKLPVASKKEVDELRAEIAELKKALAAKEAGVEAAPDSPSPSEMSANTLPGVN